jgi:hypothetical protein
MAEQKQAHTRIHPIQRLLDNPWLLLALGVVIPFISYTAWGWIELSQVPPATLP